MSEPQADGATAAPATRPPSRVQVEWLGGQAFDSGRPGGPQTRIDGTGTTAQSPPDALLSALASCSAIDLVDILAKRRTPAEKVTVHVEGRRREKPPRRFEHIILTFEVQGAGVERVHAERAITLAFEKYCSVSASLAPDIVVEASVTLNGEAGALVRQPNFVPE